jgi:hypothetical protein
MCIAHILWGLFSVVWQQGGMPKKARRHWINLKTWLSALLCGRRITVSYPCLSVEAIAR